MCLGPEGLCASFQAFFAWHVEDADLFSINFMHFGAGKVWYCVGPDERDKFDQMAESIFPDLKRECKAFMRHKDILLSPHVLRSYGIKYTQVQFRSVGCYYTI